MRKVFISRLAALTALASICSATQVPRLSFEQVVQQANQIVTGKVVRSWTAWGPSHEFLWTHYEVKVESVAKGRATAAVTVSEPGGVLDGRGMEVAGAVHYEIGERVLLFLQQTPVGYNRTVGWQQGKYTVTADGLVQGATGDARIVDLKGAAASTVRADGSTLAQMQTRIAAQVRAAQVRKDSAVQ